MAIEGMVICLREQTFNKRNIIEIQISKETFDNLIAVSNLGEEHEICGKTVVISSEEDDKKRNEKLLGSEQYCKFLEEKVEKLERVLKDLGYKPIYLNC